MALNLGARLGLEFHTFGAPGNAFDARGPCSGGLPQFVVWFFGDAAATRNGRCARYFGAAKNSGHRNIARQCRCPFGLPRLDALMANAPAPPFSCSSSSPMNTATKTSRLATILEEMEARASFATHRPLLGGEGKEQAADLDTQDRPSPIRDRPNQHRARSRGSILGHQPRRALRVAERNSDTPRTVPNTGWHRRSLAEVHRSLRTPGAPARSMNSEQKRKRTPRHAGGVDSRDRPQPRGPRVLARVKQHTKARNSVKNFRPSATIHPSATRWRLSCASALRLGEAYSRAFPNDATRER